MNPGADSAPDGLPRAPGYDYDDDVAAGDQTSIGDLPPSFTPSSLHMLGPMSFDVRLVCASN